jgi:flagellar basal-body rod protein FlgF
VQQGSVYNALSGALAMHRRLDTVSNNLANVSTNGYKQDRTGFVGVLERAQAEGGDKTAPGPAKTFPAIAEVATDHGTGKIRRTDRPLDFALQGDGFFKLRNAQGEVEYTRDGRFHLNSEGQLADQQGRLVLGPEDEPVELPSRQVQANEAGTLFTEQGQQVGQLGVVSTDSPGQLEKVGHNAYRAPEGTTMEPAANARVRSGAIEGSNVNTMEEMTRMVDLQRAYESMTKAMRTIHEAYNQNGRRLAEIGR